MASAPADAFDPELQSAWFPPEQVQELLSVLVRGDLLEFRRQGYAHWAVFVGERFVEHGEAGDVVCAPMVVHRANPVEETEGGSVFHRGFSSSASLSKGSAGLGNVVVERLVDVWGRSHARKNNILDKMISPYPPDEVVERALSAAFQRMPSLAGCYNVLTNNCEHFATFCRNGWAVSEQVTRRLRDAFQFGAVLAAGLLPRPLAIAAGLGAIGIQAIRRSSSSWL